MAVRITGISTPIGGFSWEYTKAEGQSAFMPVHPDQKIKVFISSICGVEKYDKVRAELKSSIESTQLATVYTFESKGASTLSAEEHYKLALKESDICIFLIDNFDGIKSGVQTEIDIVKKHNIKALYYFCDETQKEKTALEQSLMGARFAKSKTVHSFSELSQDGAKALIEDIIAIYHYYCVGKVIVRPDDDDEIQEIEIADTEKYHSLTIPKTTLKNVDKCRDYILKFILGYSRGKYPGETERTSELDDWGSRFLSVLFEAQSIKYFNTAMYLDVLKELQEDDYNQVVRIRWEAIQSYFAGNIEKCIEYLESALSDAKKNALPEWFVQDILIDLRNQHMIRCSARNEFTESPAQIELNESSEELYYPILDRINESLQEKYIAGFYKKKTDSPFLVSLGGNLDKYGEMLASSLIVSMYNGSLTHIRLIYERLRNFAFYLSSVYDNWSFRLSLYKLAIFGGSEKEIKGIQNSYPEILNKMTADDAASIMAFCLNQPIGYQRLNIQMLAFGAVGYFLSDKEFEYYENYIIQEIKFRLKSDNEAEVIGQNIFKALSGVAYRISQDTLGEICCLTMEKHLLRLYSDMFEFIAKRLNLRKMSNGSALSLVEHINSLFENESDREQIKYCPQFLCNLRKQNRVLTDDMDKKVAEYLPKYYENDYKLETTEDEKQDMPLFIQKYARTIKENNETQGNSGIYTWHGMRVIASIRQMLLEEEIVCDTESMDMLISVTANTLLISKESISIKLDAVSLLTCIAIKYHDDFERNQDVYNEVFKRREEIEATNCSVLPTNIDCISLKIGLCLLYISMGKDAYNDILELMPYIQKDDATTIVVTRLITEYLETTTMVELPAKVEAIILQKVLQWLHSEYVDIRWNATRILLMLSRNSENGNIVEHQLVNLIDSDCAYIKNLILRQIDNAKGISNGIKEDIISKCASDAHYVVRMVCAELYGG